MTRTLAVRARVEARPEPPFDRLLDPLTEEVVAAGPLARERFATSWRDRDALAELAAAKRAPLPSALAAELREHHKRLGAPAASLAALERLARGEAVCAVAGQQPAPLGGPLYALHKIASTVGLARRVAERTGVPCVALFWSHVEDSDFAEIRTVTVADGALALHDLTLPDDVHTEGALIGDIPVAAASKVTDQALELWRDRPSAAFVARLLSGISSRSRDLGEFESALALALFGEQGLVVIDPRLPSFRAAARPIIDRYLERADALAEAARSAGARLEGRIGRRPLNDAALDSFVFAIEGGRRRKVTVAEARKLPASVALSPSVTLRPAVQDGVFPTVVMACGPGELAYLAQLREVFEGLGVRAATAVPRLGVTWLPPAAVALIEETGADPWRAVAQTDAVIRAHAETLVPPELTAELERARAELDLALERFARLSTRVDPSLPQMVESARGKIEYQLARLGEGLTAKVRHRLEREHPEWLRLRYVLAPGDRLQERRLASLEPAAWVGDAIGGGLAELATEHAVALESGRHAHLLVEL